MTITRRQFIGRMAQAGGYGAAFITLHALGLLGMVETEQEKDFPLPPSAGRGTKVIILGAGIAGLVCAYEMRRADFDCTVLEARERPGGRNWTLRRGSKLVFDDGTSQECAFDEGNYFNCGPARLPSIHKNILGYCKELGVELEVEVNTSRSALLQNDNVFGGKSIRQGQVINDTRGYVAELLAKCVQKGALDLPLTPDDQAAMMEFLKSYGALGKNYQYSGSNGSKSIAIRFLSPICSSRSFIDRRCLKKCSTCSPPCSSQLVAWIGSPTRSRARWAKWFAITPQSLKSERQPMASECRTAMANPAGFVRSRRPIAFALCR
jgi:monoamine oxidase